MSTTSEASPSDSPCWSRLERRFWASNLPASSRRQATPRCPASWLPSVPHASRVVDLKRFGLPPRSVQRQHQMRPRLLARVLVYQPPQAHRPAGPSRPSLAIGPDPPLQLAAEAPPGARSWAERTARRGSPPARAAPLARKRLAEEISSRLHRRGRELRRRRPSTLEPNASNPLAPTRIRYPGGWVSMIDSLESRDRSSLRQLAQLRDVITHLRHGSCRNGIPVEVVRDLLHRGPPDSRAATGIASTPRCLRPPSLTAPASPTTSIPPDAEIHCHRR